MLYLNILYAYPVILSSTRKRDLGYYYLSFRIAARSSENLSLSTGKTVSPYYLFPPPTHHLVPFSPSVTRLESLSISAGIQIHLQVTLVTPRFH